MLSFLVLWEINYLHLNFNPYVFYFLETDGNTEIFIQENENMRDNEEYSESENMRDNELATCKEEEEENEGNSAGESWTRQSCREKLATFISCKLCTEALKTWNKQSITTKMNHLFIA